MAQTTTIKQKKETKPKWALTGKNVHEIAIQEAKRDGWQAGAGILRVVWPNLPKYAIDALLERRIYITKDNKVKVAKKAKDRKKEA